MSELGRALVSVVHRAFDPKPSPQRDGALLELARVSHNAADANLTSVIVSHILRLRTRIYSPLRFLVELIESPTTAPQLTAAAAYLLAFICNDASNEETMAVLEADRVLQFLLVAHNMRANQEHPSLTLSICAWALSSIAHAAVQPSESPAFRAARPCIRATTPNQMVKLLRRVDELCVEDRLYMLQFMGVLSQLEGNPAKMLEQQALSSLSAYIVREASHPDIFLNADFPLRFRNDLRVRALSEAIHTLGLLVHNDPHTPHLAAVRMSVVQDEALMRAFARCIEGAFPDPSPPPAGRLSRASSGTSGAVSPSLPAVDREQMPPPSSNYTLLASTDIKQSGPPTTVFPHVGILSPANASPSAPPLAMPAARVAASISSLLQSPSPQLNAANALPGVTVTVTPAATATVPTVVSSSPSMQPCTPPVSSSSTSASPLIPAGNAGRSLATAPITATPPPGPSASPALPSGSRQHKSVFVPVDMRTRSGYYKVARHPHHLGLHAGVALVLANCFQTSACVEVVHSRHGHLIGSLASLLSLPEPSPQQVYGALAIANMASCRHVFDSVAQDAMLVDAALEACARPNSHATPAEERFLMMLLFNLVQHTPTNLLRIAARGVGPVLAKRYISSSDPDARRLAVGLLGKLCASPVFLAVLVGADCAAPLSAVDVEAMARAGLWCAVKNIETAAAGLINQATQAIINGPSRRNANDCVALAGDVQRRCPHCHKSRHGGAHDTTHWQKRHKRTLSIPDDYTPPHSHSPVPLGPHVS